MHQRCRRADGGAALVRWLAQRTGCWVGLLDRTGRVLIGSRRELDPGAAAQVATGIDDMFSRGLRTFVIDGEAYTAVLLVVDASADVPDPVLAFVGAEAVPRSLAADAVTLLGTCWLAGETRRLRRQVEAADARCREAVLHLLMSQRISTAGQIASTLSPALPDPARVHVVECGAHERDDVIRRCAELTGGTAWMVRCPVHKRDILVLTEPHSSTLRPFEILVTEEVGGAVVGVGDVVTLHDTAVGYDQAFHALAVARGRAQRWARFDTHLDLPTIVGPTGARWADAMLGALLTYVPPRARDPDAQELMATARSWLSFSMGAAQHLKIHRHTLSGRLQRIEELLGLDLARMDQQALLDLAFRIRATPRSIGVSGSAEQPSRVVLDDLMRAPAVQQWARATLRPIREAADAATLESTLRVWLDSNSRLSATADALGISVSGARKRVSRLEQVLHRSLLHFPSARHDLWLATRAMDLGAAAERVLDSLSPEQAVDIQTAPRQCG
ncbi:helix-turn-helix domain-containing protein [Pseudonocardia sp. CA-142604]|uniref:helix-turn-helix domain-containing protein n=1 Tax=Pseudonocardia sp. CA-142604 TaxID=3240024 RepID=UPI003D909AA3